MFAWSATNVHTRVKETKNISKFVNLQLVMIQPNTKRFFANWKNNA